MTNTIIAADLFAGAGGTSTGLSLAARELDLDIELLAINHWDIAIATHSRNHPWARHMCENMDNVDPRKAVPGGKLNLLVASPECTHHSRARGGRPINDQSRASAWHVLRWAEALKIQNILIENVPEFTQWGPVDDDGSPVKHKKGKTFLAFLNALRSLDYSVAYRILNCADYGDPTIRKRLFIQARKGRRPVWPEPTHAPAARLDMFGNTRKPYTPARSIIDWSIPGESIYSRRKQLSPNTLKRIEAGLRKYGLKHPFVLGQQSCAAARSIDDPIPTIAAAGAISLTQPYLIPLNHGKGDERSHSLDDPMPTITSVDAWGVAEPYLVELRGTDESQVNRSARSIDDPLPTITASGEHHGLVEPYLVAYHGASYEGGDRARSIDDPMPTIATSNQFGLVEPYLVEFHSNGRPRSIDDPLPTITTIDRVGIAEPVIFRDSQGKHWMLDIRFRMLQPHELARGMSFPENYEFEGNRRDKVRQIGNAVPVMTAKELCKALLS
jgi:DNA (cytosine-5)-methyltransferase 1